MGIFAYPDGQSGHFSDSEHHRLRQYRTHHYEHSQQGTEFFLETSADSLVSYMTAQDPRVRQGDHIDITSPTEHLTFEVNAIEYYSNPADMWMAQLSPLA